ncbi:MAG: bis(5'-nucleosyl)-tetraphosphatase (symmetrical) YqeK [Chloroflexi bacterium]|nr:bis(5'-nucleosyl)-tetraphosphatase (symmetrical) YqeK [Chloroflexota bacterium]
MATLPVAIEARLRKLPRGLREHVERVREVGQTLARRHGADPHRVDIGIAAHDLFRAEKSGELLDIAERLGLNVHPVERRAPMLLHGPIAALWLEDHARLSDAEILESVRWHTTGHEGMSELAKVVFLADKLDPQKIARYGYLERVRALAQESLDAALLEYLNQNLAYLLREGDLIHPASLDLRNELMMR